MEEEEEVGDGWVGGWVGGPIGSGTLLLCAPRCGFRFFCLVTTSRLVNTPSPSSPSSPCSTHQRPLHTLHFALESFVLWMRVFVDVVDVVVDVVAVVARGRPRDGVGVEGMIIGPA